MKDRDFLMWIHERLVVVHKENPHVDYMHKLRAIIMNTDINKDTPNVNTGNDLEDIIESLNKRS